jgi:NDP-sugar pyrophosphorylase family protein
MLDIAVIYAGGRGERLNPLTNYVPKPLIEINKKQLIDYTIDFLKNEGVKEIYVTYNYLNKAIFKHLRKKVSGFINTIDQDNSYFLYNSFVRFINKPILCMPCDTIFETDLKQLYKDYQDIQEPSHVILSVSSQVCPNGDKLVVEGNNITEITKEINTGTSSTGIQIINPKRINKLTTPENNFYQIWKQLININELLAIEPLFSKWYTFDTITQLNNYELHTLSSNH